MATLTPTQAGFADSRISDQEFDAVRKLVYSNFGINLSARKKPLVVSRLQKVLREREFATIAEYLRWVKADTSGEALSELADKISTNHTYFNREHAHFEHFAGTVLPELIDRRERENNRELRVWCAGCSTGQEPYTLMMLIQEMLRGRGSGWSPVLLATDISVRALEAALEGVYPQDQAVKLPEHLKSRYLQEESGGLCRVDEALRSKVIFRRHNLMSPRFNFKRPFDVIFCRNVMIYFDEATKKALVSRYADSTAEGGYLFIGHSETLSRGNTRYEFIRPAVYRKIS